MPIPLDPPFIRPAVDQKTFDKLFFTDFAVAAKSPTSGDIFIRSCPMADDGSLAIEAAEETRCNLWEVAAAIPAAAAAMQAVLDVLPEIIAYSKQHQ